jgi:N-sulfoglucosamine sulfohydrolase
MASMSRILSVASLCCLLAAGSLQGASAEGLPNIVWLIADDVSPDLGAYGNTVVRTPNLDRLAADGMRLDKVFAQFASCSPSRASFFSGRYPGSMDAGDMKIPLDDGIALLPTMLRPQGYYSFNAGKLHIGGYESRAPRPGMLLHYPENARPQFDAVSSVGVVEEWEEMFDARPKDQPFFMAIGYHEAHRGWDPKALERFPYDPNEVPVPPFLADIPEVREDLSSYYSEVSYMDEKIGRVLAKLDEEGLRENTVVIFFSDHGLPFSRCKTQVYDSGVRTPFIVRWPAKIIPGGVYGGMQELVDLVPTMCEIAGADPAEGVQGASFLPVLLGKDSPGKRYVYMERNMHDTDDHIRAVRTEQFKYIENAYPDEPMANAFDLIRSPAQRAMEKLYEAGELPAHQSHAFVPHRPAVELYDLEKDPFELKNLAEDPAYRDTVEQLAQQLNHYNTTLANKFGPERRYYDVGDRKTGKQIRRSNFPTLRPGSPGPEFSQPDSPKIPFPENP